MYNKSLFKNLIVSVVVTTLMLGFSKPVFATCESTYGGGEKCVYNKSFDIEKKVRKEGNSSWKDKVTGVEEGQVVEFRIKIKNVGEVTTDDMKMIDDLPDAMVRVGGKGLTEYFDNFKPGDTKEFIIKAKVKDSEYDRDNFDKCVVNEAEVKYGDKHEGSAHATVCYSEEHELKELPKTGSESAVVATVAGFGLTALGLLIKKSRI